MKGLIGNETAMLLAICDQRGWRLVLHRGGLVSIRDAKTGETVQKPTTKKELVASIDEIVRRSKEERDV